MKDRGAMAKGYLANKERQEDIGALGKAVGKRAGFKCEWCENREDLRIRDHQPDAPPAMESLALLCMRCRDWAGGRKAAPDELRSIRNALWSDVPAIAEGAARVLAQCKEPWAREAIEESFIDEAVKAVLLK
jgi:protein PhnA